MSTTKTGDIFPFRWELVCSPTSLQVWRNQGDRGGERRSLLCSTEIWRPDTDLIFMITELNRWSCHGDFRSCEPWNWLEKCESSGILYSTKPNLAQKSYAVQEILNKGVHWRRDDVRALGHPAGSSRITRKYWQVGKSVGWTKSANLISKQYMSLGLKKC